MKVICHTCYASFRNVNHRRKHALSQTVCTRPELIKKRAIGQATQVYQRRRQKINEERRNRASRRVGAWPKADLLSLFGYISYTEGTEDALPSV